VHGGVTLAGVLKKEGQEVDLGEGQEVFCWGKYGMACMRKEDGKCLGLS
jgi:hypothetical protein